MSVLTSTEYRIAGTPEKAFLIILVGFYSEIISNLNSSLTKFRQSITSAATLGNHL